MNLDRTRNRDQVRLEFSEDFAEPVLQRIEILRQMTVAKVQELDRDGAQDGKGALRLLLTDLGIARFRAVCCDRDAHRPPIPKMEREKATASDDLIIWMRSKHEQPLASQVVRCVRNGFGLRQWHRVDYRYTGADMPGRYAIANWKMNLPPDGIPSYLRGLQAPKSTQVVVAPPFPYLKEMAGQVTLAGQNCAEQRAGAFTGEVSPDMLRDCGAEFVILGHSERRTLFGESDEMIARKLAVAIDAGLRPILCVGEDQKVRDSGEAATFVANQIKLTAVPALEKAAEVVIAYEPIWAIGTGRNATGAMVAEVVREIREALSRFWPARHRDAPILYGGSVTPDNIGDLGANGRINGYLVGGASLDCLKFSMICERVDQLSSA
jgi:triosephosphate isomerase (TIM)